MVGCFFRSTLFMNCEKPMSAKPFNTLLYLAAVLSLGVALMAAPGASAADWPQWGGTDGKNMVSLEMGLPESFVPGEKDAMKGQLRMETTKNVKWGRKLCNAVYSTPVIANGKIFVGGRKPGQGLLMCLDERTGKLLWQWEGPEHKVPSRINGWLLGISINPEKLGVCSSPVVEGDRVYFVTHSFKVMCLDASGQPDGPNAGKARVIWEYDMWDKLGVFPCDAANGSPVICGDLLYVQTSNGVDRNMDPIREIDRKVPSPNAPNLIALDKRTGRLAATDGTRIAENLLHGQWSSVALGVVGGRKLVFFGGGDGRCYAFEALASAPEQPVKLKTVWSCDCIPPEYKELGGMHLVTRYSLGDRRKSNALNRANDGTYMGMSEIIGTPVLVGNRIYVAIGRDPEHGRGRGALHCIDATKTGEITQTGKVWSYQGLDRTLSTASVAGGLLYLSDVAGRLHCLDAETGQCLWIHETKGETWGSALVADGKVYMPTAKGLVVLAAGREKKVLSQINLGAPVYATPVAANGTLYVASTGGWLWAVGR